MVPDHGAVSPIPRRAFIRPLPGPTASFLRAGEFLSAVQSVRST